MAPFFCIKKHHFSNLKPKKVKSMKLLETFQRGFVLKVIQKKKRIETFRASENQIAPKFTSGNVW